MAPEGLHDLLVGQAAPVAKVSRKVSGRTAARAADSGSGRPAHAVAAIPSTRIPTDEVQ
jgi:hypothetical protein